MTTTTKKAPAAKKAAPAKKATTGADALDALDFSAAAAAEVFREAGSYFSFNTSERGSGAPAVILNGATLPGTDVRMTQVRVPLQFEERLKRLGSGNFTVLIMALADAKLSELEATGDTTLMVTNKK